jgi:tetratricopeptide (TPR) repeat protein
MATISETLAAAVAHHQAGRLQAAERLYRQILAIEPNQPDALHLLGVLVHQLGDHAMAAQYIGRAIGVKPDAAAFHNNLGNVFKAQQKLDDALASYRRAVELKPDFAEARYNLGVALQEQGKLDDAVASYRRALELKPDYAEAHNNLGNALTEQGKRDDAVACYRRALELQPDDVEVCVNLGAVLRDQGRLDEAIACYRRALELNPADAEAHNNLGNLLKDQGRPDDAIACYRRALELKPDDAELYNNLGNALRDQKKPNDAIACYQRALERKPDFATAHYNLGIALKDSGKPDDAIACFRRALELKPDYAAAHNNLGTTLEEMGDLQGAERCFRTATQYNHRFAHAHYNLAKLLGRKLPQPDLDAQRRLLVDSEWTDAQRLLLHFGVAQVLNARGEYAEAAEHLDRGNALQLSEWRKRGQEYDPKEHEAFIARMIDACTPEFFERVRGFGVESETPVFVVGLPRSGTTLTEQILASHSQVFGAGEITLVRETMAGLAGPGADSIDGLRQLNATTAGRFAARHLQQLCALNPAARRVVDKMPENYLYLGLLATLFPRAKLIHCRRDLRDVAVSCWMTQFRDIRWASDQRHMASRFHEYQRIMGHWRKVLPLSLLEVDYEETVADLEGVARRLVAWCGLAWEPACLAFQQTRRAVRTASSVQVRQPVFATSVGRWKHYEPALSRLFAELENDAAG